MTDTFAWSAHVGATGKTTLRTKTAQFGDGYSQAVADGVNAKVASWPLSFVGTSADITPIVTFLDNHAGYQSFYWTPPLGAQGLYRCSSYELGTANAVVDVYMLSATFQQVFAP